MDASSWFILLFKSNRRVIINGFYKWKYESYIINYFKLSKVSTTVKADASTILLDL